jgi:hypothetical protein
MTIVVPTGANSAEVQVLDANGADISGTCQLQAESSDPTVIQIGNPDATTPNLIPFTALQPGATATIKYTATNSVGNVSQTDTLQVEVTTPSSMKVTYGTTLPVAPQPIKSKK